YQGGRLTIEALTWWFVDYADAKQHRKRGLGITVWSTGVVEGHLAPAAWIRFDEGQLLSTFSMQSEALTVDMVRSIQFVIAGGAFMRQRLAAVEKQPADRHARKRLAAGGWASDPIVDVVVLRARDSASTARTSDDPAHRDFRWQWMVRAHTRHQYYPSLAKHLPILI